MNKGDVDDLSPIAPVGSATGSTLNATISSSLQYNKSLGKSITLAAGNWFVFLMEAIPTISDASGFVNDNDEACGVFGWVDIVITKIEFNT